MMKIINENSLKLDDFEMVTSMTSKTTSKAPQPQNPANGFYFKFHF